MAQKEELLVQIKKAMQGEMDSVTLYANAAEHSDDPEVKEFFAGRREEELRHYYYLLRYHQEIAQDKTLSEEALEELALPELHPIFSADFVKRIGADQYLFSAISTALLLEKDAFEHYGKLAQMAGNLTLQGFFALLEKWEMRHYDELLEIQKQAERHYWEANSFEPF